MSYYGARAYPTCYFDGTDFWQGGGSGVYDQYIAIYNNHKNVPGPLAVTFLANSYAGEHASVKVKVKLEESLGEGHVCHIILWEDKVAGQYNFVERRMAQYEVLTVKNVNDEQVIKRNFTLDAGWNKANLGVSAWVQNFAGKQILNGRATKLVEGVAVTPTSLGRVKALFN
jgi:hypothetical protein